MKKLCLPLAAALLGVVPASHAGNSLAEISIYDRNARRQLPTYERDGRVYMAGKPGSVYEVRQRRFAEPRLGTGHGRRQISHVRQVEFERESHTPNDIGVFHYDSYANLLAQGIIEREPRDPQPFPVRFVPDPPLRTQPQR